MVHVSAETLAGHSPERPLEIDTANTLATTPINTTTITPTTKAANTSPKATKAKNAGTKKVAAETFFHPETLRRLACDGGMVTVVEKANGDPLSIGRKSRVIPSSMRRALVARDRHCQYPGCSHERYVEGHHMVHWAHGGATRLDNLVLLCSHHHRTVHEFGERIKHADDGKISVTKIPNLKTVCTGNH